MKSVIFGILILVVFVLAGCSATKNNTAIKKEQNTQNIQSDTLQMTEKRLVKECKAENKESCKELGDYFYNQAKYSDAADIYDYTCAKFWHIPACLKLAHMFEVGLGVEKNEFIAKDIYKRSCYSGDKESCNKIR